MTEGPGHDQHPALLSEQLIFPPTRVLHDEESVGGAKALLVRRTDVAVVSGIRLRLTAVTSAAEWQDYERQRVAVEAGFGVGPAQTGRAVAELRERQKRIGLDLYLAHDGSAAVGAVGRFRLPVPYRRWTRLQEVDVFPRPPRPGLRKRAPGGGPRAADRGRQRVSGGGRRRGRLAAVVVPPPRLS